MTQGHETKVSNFDEWFIEQLDGRDETQQPFKIAKMWSCGAYKAGAASRQAEINLLEKEIIETQEFLNNQNCIKQAEIDGLNALGEMSEQKIDDLVLRNIELQKRIDDVLNTIEPSEEISHMLYRKVYKILKGDRNE